MGIKIPKEITTAQDKMAWALRLVEQLRLEHNAKGALVDKKSSAAVAEFHEWQSKVFEPVQEEALMYANQAKQAMYQDKKWDAQIDAKSLLDANEAEVRK